MDFTEFLDTLETGYAQTKRAFADALEQLGLEYLDLYLVHMPFGDYYGSWCAMEACSPLAEGKQGVRREEKELHTQMRG